MGNRIFLRWAVVLPLGLLWMASAASCSQVVPGSKGEPPSPTELIGPPITSIDGVSFSLDPAVAAGAQGQVVPENPGSQDGPYWEVHPQYVSISLDGYPLSGTQMNPGIYIYPIEDYGRLSPQAGGILDSLKDFLVQKPSDADQIPFLPIFNAGQVFHSNVDWLDFQNGSGVRFLTIYAQYPAPVNNQDLFYTFQGLTSDGRHSVSVILPVNHPALPADLAAVSESEMEAILHDYDLYREDV
ncbi:MAG: hypothetical protein R3335_07230, partial [Anaerolineales bacterium]|nr:hypothetical protein [Anaerolineales bacterium]